MVIANYRDRAHVEPAELEAELIGYGRDAYNAVARELGWQTWGAVAKPSRGGAAQHRCEWEQGYCAKFTSSRYCREHTVGEMAAHYADRRGA
ncbi:MAG TPA: hypothetical protein VGN13_05455 [Solirubrobacteraceae bacterium]|jgi:hypothetical protein